MIVGEQCLTSDNAFIFMLSPFYWESVVSESGEIVKGYENSRLSRDLILAALSELERVVCLKSSNPCSVSGYAGGLPCFKLSIVVFSTA